MPSSTLSIESTREPGRPDTPRNSDPSSCERVSSTPPFNWRSHRAPSPALRVATIAPRALLPAASGGHVSLELGCSRGLGGHHALAAPSDALRAPAPPPPAAQQPAALSRVMETAGSEGRAPMLPPLPAHPGPSSQPSPAAPAPASEVRRACVQVGWAPLALLQLNRCRRAALRAPAGAAGPSHLGPAAACRGQRSSRPVCRGAA